MDRTHTHIIHKYTSSRQVTAWRVFGVDLVYPPLFNSCTCHRGSSPWGCCRWWRWRTEPGHGVEEAIWETPAGAEGDRTARGVPGSGPARVGSASPAPGPEATPPAPRPSVLALPVCTVCQWWLRDSGYMSVNYDGSKADVHCMEAEVD